MPWHDVQCVKMTARTGPYGGSTCGLVGLFPNCAITGTAGTTKAAIPTTENTKKNLSVLCVLSGGDVLRVLIALTRSPAAPAAPYSSRSCPARCRRGAGG